MVEAQCRENTDTQKQFEWTATLEVGPPLRERELVAGKADD